MLFFDLFSKTQQKQFQNVLKENDVALQICNRLNE